MSDDDGVLGTHTGPDTLEARIEATIRRHNLAEAERYGRIRTTTTYPQIPLADLLAFEEQWEGKPPGQKHAAVMKTFHGRPIARYEQLVNNAIDTPEALELNPMLVNRLRDNREARVKARTEHTFRPTR